MEPHAMKMKLQKMFYHFLILGKSQIVLADGDHKQDGGDAVKTVNPLLALRPLTSDIHDPSNQEAQIMLNRKIQNIILCIN